MGVGHKELALQLPSERTHCVLYDWCSVCVCVCASVCVCVCVCVVCVVLMQVCVFTHYAHALKSRPYIWSIFLYVRSKTITQKY